MNGTPPPIAGRRPSESQVPAWAQALPYALAPSFIQFEPPVVDFDRDILAQLDHLRTSFYKNVQAFQLTWDRMLKPSERLRLTKGNIKETIDSFGACPHLLMMCVRPWWIYRAVVEVAYGISQIDMATYRSLRQALAPADPVRVDSIDRSTLYAEAFDQDADIHEAVMTKRLVVVHTPGIRELYWEHEPVEADWRADDKLWQFVSLLVHNARKLQPVRWDDFFGAQADTPGKWKSRLMRRKPQALWQHVQPTGDAGTYRIVGIAPDEIAWFGEVGNWSPTTHQAP